MKVLGALLILCGALWGHLQHRRQLLLPLKLGRALVSDLAILRGGICISRRPIPAILERELSGGLGAEYLWRPFGMLLREELTVREAWIQAIALLPERFAVRLAPLGPLLGMGGELLANAIDEVREELLHEIRTGDAYQAEQAKLSAALCFSGACLMILILL